MKIWFSRLPGAWPWFTLLAGAAFISALTVDAPLDPDEVAQQTRFAAYKAGWRHAGLPPMEHALRMRSWIQPGVAYAVGRLVTRFCGLYPLLIERCVMLVDFALFALALALFVRMAKPQQPALARAPVFAHCGVPLWATICFLPNMLVRHTSDAWGALFLTLGLYAWWRAERCELDGPGAPWLWLAGALFGLGCVVRFHTVIIVVTFLGVRSVTALLKGQSLRSLAGFSSAFSAALLLGVFIDRWGYGDWTLSPYNYFDFNILGGGVSRYWQLPWHYYLTSFVRDTYNPVVWVAFLYALFALRREPFLWAVACGASAYLLIHFAVPLKSARFLLPVYPAMALVTLGLYAQLAAARRNPFERVLGFVPLGLAVGLLGSAQLIEQTWTLATDRPWTKRRALEALPPGSVVIGPHAEYARFDEYTSVRSPRGRTREEDIYWEDFLRPPHVRFVSALREETSLACARHPGGFVYAAGEASESLIRDLVSMPFVARKLDGAPAHHFVLARCSDLPRPTASGVWHE